MSDSDRITALERDFESRREFWHDVNNKLQQVVGGMKGMRQLHESNGKKIDTLADDVADMKAVMAKLARGFPGGDAEAHRLYHEALIERINLRNQLVRAALEKLVQAGALAGFGWLAIALWQYFKFQVRS